MTKRISTTQSHKNGEFIMQTTIAGFGIVKRIVGNEAFQSKSST